MMMLAALVFPRRALLRCSEDSAAGDLSRAQNLESLLSLAVQTERYEEAARLRDELASLGVDTELAVLQANNQFYRSFSDADLQAMDELWAADGVVACTHPGHSPLTGRESIMSSWQNIFSADAGRSIRIRPTAVQCSVQGRLAFVSCVEQVDPGSGQTSAVNIFAQQLDGSWRMAVHHAGPVFM